VTLVHSWSLSDAGAAAHTLSLVALRSRSAQSLPASSRWLRGGEHTAMKKLRIVILRLGTARDREWLLNDGQIQNPYVQS
jgi:hypothetical protein